MAHFLIIRDPDDMRRRDAVAKARRCLEAEQLGKGNAWEQGDLSVVWGTAAESPSDQHTGPDGWCLVLGEIMAGPTSTRSNAADYLRGLTAVEPESFDGLHAGLAVSPAGDLTVGTDLLGIFPVYHTVAAEVLLVASAPGLLVSHPAYQASLDPLGLTGLLLTNGLVDGVTIFKRVRRLAPGHLLRAPACGQVAETPRYRFAVSTTHYDQPMLEWAWRLHEALVSSCRRHVVDGMPHTLLLSGGLDSRLLAGLLARQGVTVTAVTQGLSTDNDFRCARRVARELGFTHRQVTREGGTWETFTRALRWNGMTAFPTLGADAVVQAVRGLHPRVVSGYLMDAVVGGSHMQWCYSRSGHDTGYEPWFAMLNGLGIRVETLRRLLRPEVFGDSLDEMLARVKRRFLENGDSFLERAWRFDLEGRQRFVIGGVLVRQMRGAWPVAPHIDREVLSTAAGIPLGAIASRVVEREIVIRFHRNLARLPLDRGDDVDNSPLDADVRSVLRALPGRALRQAAVALRLPLRERRSWYRTFSLDGPGWVDVRRDWENMRPAAHALFVPEVFDGYLPPPGTRWPTTFKMTEFIGRKLLMGATVLSAGADQSGDGLRGQ